MARKKKKNFPVSSTQLSSGKKKQDEVQSEMRTEQELPSPASHEDFTKDIYSLLQEFRDETVPSWKI